MSRRADLSPPLGLYGGPCLVVQRIEDEIRSDRLKHDLAEKVEKGQKLTNPEAAKVYSIEGEKGGGIFRQMRITPHAQYRMDQRGITVGDLQVALRNFSKKLNDWKSQRAVDYDHAARALSGRGTFEWIDKKLGDLVVVVGGGRGKGVVDIVTTYWKGLADPRPQTCGLHPRHAGIQQEKDFGIQTWVKNPQPSTSDTDSGKYPTRGLPSPPWSRSKPTGPHVYNMPGESGSNSDGTIHKDKVRTKGVPGGQYDGGKTHPTKDYNETGITPNRRPGLTADAWLDADDDDLFLLEASYKPQFPSAHPPGNKRQRKQKGRAYRYFHKRYKRLKGRIKRMVKRRYNRLKKNNRFINKRNKAKQRPERHQRRPGGGPSTIAERSRKQREKSNRNRRAFGPFPFYHYPTDLDGHIIEVSPCGFVHFILNGERGVAEFETFFDEVVIEDELLEGLFDYMDLVFEWEGDDSLLEEEEEEEDSLFDAWLEGSLPKLSYQVRQRPKKRQRRQRGLARWKSKRRNRRNRQKNKMRAKQRYRRLKNNPSFKKQQQIRRKYPQRFKRRRAEVLTAPEIAFVFIEEGMPLGYVRNVSGMTGLVTFYLDESGSRMIHSEMLPEFLRRAVFLSDEDIDAMYELIDAEVGIEAFSDEVNPDSLGSDHVNTFIPESDFMHEDGDERQDDIDALLIDPTDDDYFYGIVNKLAADVLGSFYREPKPPQMDPDTKFNRGTSLDKAREKRKENRKPGDNFFPYMEEVMNSNPGSRVLPTGQGHVTDKNAALIKDIREGCSPDILQRSRGLTWRLARVDTKNAMWLFDVQGSSGSHRVRLKAVRKGNVRDMQKAHVKVSCSCPFWQWQGPEFHAKQGDYLYGRPRGTASRPSTKDPNMHHRACKHVIAVLRHVTDRKWSVPGLRGKQGSLHYLADTLDQGEVIVVGTQFEMHREALAARYLAHQAGGE